MAVRSKGKKEVVLIDADWLLGDAGRPTRRVGSQFVHSVLFLSAVAAFVWAWPHLSKRWLEWDWQSQLSESEQRSSEDVLPILVALNDLNPNQNAPLVEQLASLDIEKRLIAFHLLQQKLERWSKNRPTNSELESLWGALMSMRNAPPESILLRGQLAARLTHWVDASGPNASKYQTGIDSMIAEASSFSKPIIKQSAPLGAESGDSITSAVPTITPASKASSSLVPATRMRIGDTAPPSSDSITDSPSLVPSQGTLQSVSRVPTETVTAPLGSQPPAYSSGPSYKLPPPRISVGTSTIPNAVAVKPIQVVNPAPMVSLEELAFGNGTTEQQPDAGTLSGLNNLPTEKLLTLLASTQRKLVQESSNELKRRGISSEQLELLMDLAQGDVERRLAMMEQLKHEPDTYAIQVLAWLAEQSDAKVRRKAIAFLGAIPTQDAVRSLRMLKLREPDGPIADQISQVLLAVGTNANSRR
ncbi:MAG: HEAT repeat domain-containing protein [Pirellula sp.]